MNSQHKEAVIGFLGEAFGKVVGITIKAGKKTIRSLSRGLLWNIVIAIVICAGLFLAGNIAVIKGFLVWNPTEGRLDDMLRVASDAKTRSDIVEMKLRHRQETLEEKFDRRMAELDLRFQDIGVQLEELNCRIDEDKARIGMGQGMMMLCPRATPEAVWAVVDAAFERRRPELILAIAIRECNDLDPEARGDGGRAWGIWQIHRYWWDDFLQERTGNKPTDEDYFDPMKSAEYAEHIMESLYLEADGNVRKALKMYNGGISGWTSPKTTGYANEVLRNYAMFREIREMVKKS